MAIIVLQPTLFSGKVCHQCRFWYPLTQFHHHSQYPNKRGPTCISCFNTPYSGSSKSVRETLDRQWVADRQRASHRKESAYVRAGRLRGKFSKDEWRDLCNQYGNCCLRCGATGKLSADHVIPVSRGGSNTIDNIQPLCLPCNMWKRARVIDYRPLHTTRTDYL